MAKNRKIFGDPIEVADISAAKMYFPHELKDLDESELNEFILNGVLFEETLLPSKEVILEQDNPVEPESYLEEFESDFTPMFSYIYLLPDGFIPKQEQIDLLYKKVPDVSIIKTDDEKYALGLNGVGQDMSGHILYAHYLLGVPVPKSAFERGLKWYKNNYNEESFVPYVKEAFDFEKISKAFEDYDNAAPPSVSTGISTPDVYVLNRGEIEARYPLKAWQQFDFEGQEYRIERLSKNIDLVLYEEVDFLSRKAYEIYSVLSEEQKQLLSDDVRDYFEDNVIFEVGFCELDDVINFKDSLKALNEEIEENDISLSKNEHIDVLKTIEKNLEEICDNLNDLENSPDENTLRDIVDAIEERDFEWKTEFKTEGGFADKIDRDTLEEIEEFSIDVERSLGASNTKKYSQHFGMNM